MSSNDLDGTVLKVLKRIMLLALGSGLLTNSLYIYGVAYYQGYVERLGFEFAFFPIQWSEAILWTYFASREFGVSTIVALTELSQVFFIMFLFAFYLIARIWMELSDPRRARAARRRRKKINFRWRRKVYDLKEKYIWTYRLAYIPLRWVLLKEQSFIAFMASYFFLVFLLFVPIFIMLWIYFPLVGLAHGEAVAEQRIEGYEQKLCGGEEDFWSMCVALVNTASGESAKDKTIEGKILFKNGNLLGLMTKTGPVTMTMPKTHFHRTRKNHCFNSKCVSEEGASDQ